MDKRIKGNRRGEEKEGAREIYEGKNMETRMGEEKWDAAGRWGTEGEEKAKERAGTRGRWAKLVKQERELGMECGRKKKLA